MKAMILAAGRGERMRPLTDKVPKPLLCVGGYPLIVWHIMRLVQAGFDEIVVNVSWLGYQIEQELGDGSRWKARLSYSREEVALETAGGIRQALHLLGNQPFLVVNADIYTDYPFINLNHAYCFLSQGVQKAHLVLVDNPPHHQQGDFGLFEGRLTQTPPYLTFSGISMWHPSVFDGLALGEKCPLAQVIHQMMPDNCISAERYTGLWVDAGTMERLSALDRSLLAG
ncbi:MAG: nucleotidyltransferase family protein [Proteobacteria bacterium]|nr:nucleotidyltransferase family protein [Pseudomonadota bacterium]MDE3207239.1 nucleotidyltransferase family protein [Pseudomonadota bacterium]